MNSTSSSRIDGFRSKERRLIAGIMSGTSLDGIDVALVEIEGTGSSLRHRLHAFSSTPFPSEFRDVLLRASRGAMSLREAFELDADLGALYAEAINSALESAGIQLIQLDAVGLHGQTVYHAPRRQPNGVTVQLGSPAVVAQRLSTAVVSDFRSGDVAAGGEGAPLVPYCDFVLLHSPERNRIALNIGGIANLTWLPSDASLDTLVAFDTGPGNMLIDAAMRKLFGADYDEGGERAAAGSVDRSWLDRLLEHPYFIQSPPKSTGRELFGEEVGHALVEEGLSLGISDHDIIATLTAFTSGSIAGAIASLATTEHPVDEIIVGGGGVHNRTLMKMLRNAITSAQVISSDAVGLPSDAKEAICFAILANEALCETPANVPSVTGAARPVICGSITLP